MNLSTKKSTPPQGVPPRVCASFSSLYSYNSKHDKPNRVNREVRAHVDDPRAVDVVMPLIEPVEQQARAEQADDQQDEHDEIEPVL